MSTRITILEAREKQLSKKLEHAVKLSSLAEQQRHESQKMQKNLEINLDALSRDFIMMKEDLKNAQEELAKSIRKEEAEQIKRYNE